MRGMRWVWAVLLLVLGGCAGARAWAGEAPGYTFPPSGGGSGTISSGTTGYLPKYTGATTIGDSALEDAGAGEINVHVGALQATLNFGGMAAHQYYTFPDVANANLTGNTVAVLAPSLSLNGGTRLAGVAVSAPTFSSGAVATNVATINTTAAHGLTTGDIVTVSSSTGVTVDGTFRVTVVDADTFTYAITVGNGTITAATITPQAQLQLGGAATTASPLTDVVIGATATTQIPLVMQAKASQTADLQVWQPSTGNNTVNLTVKDPYSLVVGFGNSAGVALHYGGVASIELGANANIAWGGGGPLNQATDTGLKRVEPAVVGITNGSTGGGIVEFPDVASLGTVSADSARIGSVAGEMWVKDAAGNATQISPHAKGSPGYDPVRDQPQDIVIQHFNAYLGKWEFVHLSRFIREYEAASGKQYIYEKPIAKADWNADQQKLQDAYDAARAEELAAKAAYDAKPAEARAGTSAPVVREAKDIKKPCPAWMQPAQAGK